MNKDRAPEYSSIHVPVLLNEVISHTQPRKREVVVDATLGGGGHAEAFISRIGPEGFFLGLDADPEAVKRFKANYSQPNVTALCGNFRSLDELMAEVGLKEADVILFDLGISSDQLDDPKRGFTFKSELGLDMRMNPHGQELSAADFINTAGETEIAGVIKQYGEERHHRRLARAIVKKREFEPIQTAQELFDLIKKALPSPLRHTAEDVARRTFQGLRIYINQELSALEQALPIAFSKLNSGGRLAVISFHSLEDRMVKQFFVQLAVDCVCPPEFPICICGGGKAEAEILTPKVIKATPEETERNSRSRSARLRVIKKI